TLTVENLNATSASIAQVALGSLALLPADGSGVLFDPGFSAATGGISGTLLTAFGNATELSPHTLKLSSSGLYVTAVIEVAGGGAAYIVPSSVKLEIGSGSVGVAGSFAPQLGDADGDTNADLKVKFDRAAVQALIPGGASSVTGTVSWSYTDGGTGSASATIQVVM
ncbi:MAG: hypothetical protein HY508_07015, partial [Acidobacteria bacterium]|nr:hypothetical protein [Acidobacteriota bacterium]